MIETPIPTKFSAMANEKAAKAFASVKSSRYSGKAVSIAQYFCQLRVWRNLVKDIEVPSNPAWEATKTKNERAEDYEKRMADFRSRSYEAFVAFQVAERLLGIFEFFRHDEALLVYAVDSNAMEIRLLANEISQYQEKGLIYPIPVPSKDSLIETRISLDEAIMISNLSRYPFRHVYRDSNTWRLFMTPVLGLNGRESYYRMTDGSWKQTPHEEFNPVRIETKEDLVNLKIVKQTNTELAEFVQGKKFPTSSSRSHAFDFFREEQCTAQAVLREVSDIRPPKEFIRNEVYFNPFA
jgi:hypothetical protein